MKAYILKANGSPENLLLANIPEPKLKSGEVLVNVRAISINPVDAAVRQSRDVMMKIMKIESEQEYYIPGWDISGVVMDANTNDAGKIGKEVFGMVNFPGQGRAYAEFVVAPAGQLATKPSNISHEEAAGSTLAALTAWQSLITHGKLKKDDRVLIHAAAGGVGHYAVQIAKHFGAYVIGTASAVNRDFILSLGADEFIDYTTQRFEENISDADLILDSINNRDHLARSLQACKPGGRLISIKSYFDDELLSRARERNIYTDRILVASNGDDMKSLAQLLEKGLLKSHISKIYPFDDLPDAHRQVESGKTRGKIIISL